MVEARPLRRRRKVLTRPAVHWAAVVAGYWTAVNVAAPTLPPPAAVAVIIAASVAAAAVLVAVIVAAHREPAATQSGGPTPQWELGRLEAKTGVPV